MQSFSGQCQQLSLNWMIWILLRIMFCSISASRLKRLSKIISEVTQLSGVVTKTLKTWWDLPPFSKHCFYSILFSLKWFISDLGKSAKKKDIKRTWNTLQLIFYPTSVDQAQSLFQLYFIIYCLFAVTHSLRFGLVIKKAFTRSTVHLKYCCSIDISKCRFRSFILLQAQWPSQNLNVLWVCGHFRCESFNEFIYWNIDFP